MIVAKFFVKVNDDGHQEMGKAHLAMWARWAKNVITYNNPIYVPSIPMQQL